MATPTRPTATHRFIANNADECACFQYADGVFYALESMATFIVDGEGRVWKYAISTDPGAKPIPLPWWKPTRYGLPSGGFIEAL